jgi:hypothetical protein
MRLGLSPLLDTAILGGYRYHPQNLQWHGQQVPPLRGRLGIARGVKGGGEAATHPKRGDVKPKLPLKGAYKVHTFPNPPVS